MFKKVVKKIVFFSVQSLALFILVINQQILSMELGAWTDEEEKQFVRSVHSSDWGWWRAKRTKRDYTYHYGDRASNAVINYNRLVNSEKSTDDTVKEARYCFKQARTYEKSERLFSDSRQSEYMMIKTAVLSELEDEFEKNVWDKKCFGLCGHLNAARVVTVSSILFGMYLYCNFI